MKCPASCQRADRLDGARIGLGGEDLRLGVGLPHRGGELLGLEAVDLPYDLLRVRDRHAEAALGHLLEQVPVVVQGRVDVDRDAHGASGTVEAHARNAPRQVPRRAAAPGPGSRLRPPGPRGVARRRLGAAPAPDPASTAARPTTSTWARARRSCSSTASAPPGSRGWRTCPSSRATTAWWRWTCRASATPRCRPRTSRSSATRAGASRCSTRSGIGEAALVGNSMGGFIAAEHGDPRSRSGCAA